MLTDSSSPLNDLQNLVHWRKLPETEEALAVLRELAEVADRMGRAPEASYVQTLNAGVQFLPDGNTIAAMRARFQGQAKGFHELERMLDEREKVLRDTLEQQDNKAK